MSSPETSSRSDSTLTISASPESEEESSPEASQATSKTAATTTKARAIYVRIRLTSLPDLSAFGFSMREANQSARRLFDWAVAQPSQREPK